MTKVAVVAAGLSVPSSTRLLADRLAYAVGEVVPDAVIDLIELRPLARPLADRLVTGFAGAELEDALGRVRDSDALVVVTPVFAASYSGLFKTFFDVMEPESLDGKPVLLAATAGTARHSLVIDHALRPLFAYLHALVVPTGVFAATDDFGADADLSGRVLRAAGELADLIGHASLSTPAKDEFADPTPFTELLRRATPSPSPTER